MKKILLTALVTCVLGIGNAYGMTDTKRVGGTRNCSYPQPRQVRRAGITVSTYDADFLDTNIPKNFFDSPDTRELAKKFGHCKKWNDAIEIIAIGLETNLKAVVGLKRTAEEFEEILHHAHAQIESLLGIEYEEILFYVDTNKRGRFEYPRRRERVETESQVRPCTFMVSREHRDELENKTEVTAGNNQVDELETSFEDLVITEQDVKKSCDEKFEDEEREKIHAIRIEISEVRLMLRELLEQRESGNAEERELARALITGIELIKLSEVPTKVSDMVSEKGFNQLVNMLIATNKTRRCLMEIIPHAEEKNGLFQREANEVLNGFLHFAKIIFKDDLSIRTLLKNNVALFKIGALVTFLTQRTEKGLTKNILRCCSARDVGYARAFIANCEALQKRLHEDRIRKLNPPVKKDDNWCEPLDLLLSTAHCACVAGFCYYAGASWF